MSFSSELKTELALFSDMPSCCYHAQVYGLVLFAHFSSSNISVKTENDKVFSLYCDYVKEIIGKNLTLNLSGVRKKIALVDEKADREKIFNYFGHSIYDTTLRINFANFQNECCISSFLRGVFLSCGSVSDPNKSYHLEFVVPYKKLSQDLIRVFNEIELYPKYILRKGYHILYFKDSESIEDFFSYIGSSNATLYLMNIQIEKDIKNKVNRKLNFEMHNLERTISASTSQVEAVEYIISTAGLSFLPDNLKTVAVLRRENPEASLNELISLSDEKLSKSGMKHRLDKIVEIAEKLKKENSEE